MATWRMLIGEALKDAEESWEDVECIVFGIPRGYDPEWYGPLPDPADTEECLEMPFDKGFGSTNGMPFTMWTAERVYFPACYDGAEWVDSVQRNPVNPHAKEHVGGG